MSTSFVEYNELSILVVKKLWCMPDTLIDCKLLFLIDDLPYSILSKIFSFSF